VEGATRGNGGGAEAVSVSGSGSKPIEALIYNNAWDISHASIVASISPMTLCCDQDVWRPERSGPGRANEPRNEIGKESKYSDDTEGAEDAEVYIPTAIV
jgi:hypothetical protein